MRSVTGKASGTEAASESGNAQSKTRGENRRQRMRLRQGYGEQGGALATAFYVGAEEFVRQLLLDSRMIDF